MVRNNSFFYLSGFLSLSLFTFFLSLFLYMMFSSTTIDTYAMKKDNYISISLEIPKVVTKTSNKNVNTAPKEIAAPEEVQEVDVVDLFSDVWTKKIRKEKVKPKDTKRILELQKKIKTSKSKDIESITEKIKNLDQSEVSDENNPTSTANQVNEYLAKINALVYRHFNPPQNSQGNSVRAVIELSAIGKVLDFRILSYSSSDSLNQECDKLKERLTRVVFPLNPKNESSRTTIILTSKE